MKQLFQWRKEMRQDGVAEQNQQIQSNFAAYYIDYSGFTNYPSEHGFWRAPFYSNFQSQVCYHPTIPYQNYLYVSSTSQEDPQQRIPTGQASAGPDQREQRVVKQENESLPVFSQELQEEQLQRASVTDEKWRQKFGRNIMSNIFHMAIRKISTHTFSEHVKDVIRQNRLVIREEEFINKLTEKNKLTNSYINGKNMKKLLIGNPIGATKVDIEFRKMLRTLIRLYLSLYHIPHIYHSGKIKKQSRELHLQALRKLTKKIAKL